MENVRRRQKMSPYIFDGNTNPHFFISYLFLFLFPPKNVYTRISRVFTITGAYKHWGNDIQNFTSSTSENLKKNQLLLDLKNKNIRRRAMEKRES